MILGERLRTLREARHLSQGDIARRSGLLPSYVSRIENDHTLPSIDTLEKVARALGVPMHQLFYGGGQLKPPKFAKAELGQRLPWGRTRKDRLFLHRLHQLLARMDQQERKLLFWIARKIVQLRAGKAKPGK